MNDRLLTAFRMFLILWTGAIIAHFTYVQLVTDWGATEPAWRPANLWHPYWFGVLYAAFVVVPFALLHVPTARRYGAFSSAAGRAILAFGAGTVLWGMGNLFWFIKNVQGDDAPYPSLADAGYLAVLPLAGYALVQMSRVVGLTRADWMKLPLALAVAFPLNAYIMLPQGVGAGTFDTPVTTVISTTYMVSDVVLLGIGILVAIGARRAAGGRFFAPALSMTAAIGLLYVGDIFFNYRIATETFYNADISDLLYASFFVTSSLATYLLLAADVRAAEAVAHTDATWTPDLEQEAATSDVLVPPLVSVPTAILHAQERVMGTRPAHGIAAGVAGITLDANANTATAVDQRAIDTLVRTYRSIAGPLGEMACWTASRALVARHPELEIPSFARFRAASGAGAQAAPSSRDGNGIVAANAG